MTQPESEIIAKLPVTHDGVVVVPLVDDVFAVINNRVEVCGIVAHETNRGWIAQPWRWDIYHNVLVSSCYSTESAAKSAIKTGDEQ